MLVKSLQTLSDDVTFQCCESTDDYVSPMEVIRHRIRHQEIIDDEQKLQNGIIGEASSQFFTIDIFLLLRAGHVVECERGRSWRSLSKSAYKSTVNFKWQRGTKLGEGSFGQVYTCVNLDNGQILAMKEVRWSTTGWFKTVEVVAGRISE